MPDEPGHAGAGPAPTGAGLPRSRPALPPEVVAGLRAAFEQEVRRRVPRLGRLHRPVPGPEVLAAAVRDAHSLAGSAVVVGEGDAARCARGLEEALEQCLRDPLAPLPAAVPAEVDRLARLLDAWLAR